MRVTVVKDDLTGDVIDEEDATQVEVMFGDYAGTFEGAPVSIEAISALFRDHDPDKLMALMGISTAPVKPSKPRTNRSSSNGDHAHTRQWCQTLPGMAAVKRLGVEPTAKGLMPKALVEA